VSIKKSVNRWFPGRKQKSEAPDQAPPAAPSPPPAAASVEPDVVAVIATVVAIEVKMFMALQGRSFTFNVGGPAQGWSDWGRLLIRPFQGVR
jgi:hypothetical protein